MEKRYSLTGLNNYFDARRELSKLLAGWSDPWLLEDLTVEDAVRHEDPILHSIAVLSLEKGRDGAVSIIADLSKNHPDKANMVIDVLSDLQKELGGQVTYDAGNPPSERTVRNQAAISGERTLADMMSQPKPDGPLVSADPDFVVSARKLGRRNQQRIDADCVGGGSPIFAYDLRAAPQECLVLQLHDAALAPSACERMNAAIVS